MFHALATGSLVNERPKVWFWLHTKCQGSQYTSKEFVSLILSNDVKFSMDGKGRALDNVYIERFWRSLKQEYVYIFVPESGHQLHDGLKKYFEFYNFKRKHQNINDQVPNCVQLTTVMIITQLGSIEKVGQH